MADKGYIKIHRKIWDNPIFASGERFDRRSAWLYLISHANYADGEFMSGGRLRHVQRGQLFTSVRYLARLWGWDKNTVSRYLSDIEVAKMITVTRTQGGTLITVVNYSKYQDSVDSSQKNRDTYADTNSPKDSPTHADADSPLLKKNIKKNLKKSKEGSAQIVE